MSRVWCGVIVSDGNSSIITNTIIVLIIVLIIIVLIIIVVVMLRGVTNSIARFRSSIGCMFDSGQSMQPL